MRRIQPSHTIEDLPPDCLSEISSFLPVPEDAYSLILTSKTLYEVFTSPYVFSFVNTVFKINRPRLRVLLAGRKGSSNSKYSYVSILVWAVRYANLKVFALFPNVKEFQLHYGEKRELLFASLKRNPHAHVTEFGMLDLAPADEREKILSNKNFSRGRSLRGGFLSPFGRKDDDFVQNDFPVTPSPEKSNVVTEEDEEQKKNLSNKNESSGGRRRSPGMERFFDAFGPGMKNDDVQNEFPVTPSQEMLNVTEEDEFPTPEALEQDMLSTFQGELFFEGMTKMNFLRIVSFFKIDVRDFESVREHHFSKLPSGVNEVHLAWFDYFPWYQLAVMPNLRVLKMFVDIVGYERGLKSIQSPFLELSKGSFNTWTQRRKDISKNFELNFEPIPTLERLVVFRKSIQRCKVDNEKYLADYTYVPAFLYLFRALMKNPRTKVVLCACNEARAGKDMIFSLVQTRGSYGGYTSYLPPGVHSNQVGLGIVFRCQSCRDCRKCGVEIDLKTQVYYGFKDYSKYQLQCEHVGLFCNACQVRVHHSVAGRSCVGCPECFPREDSVEFCSSSICVSSHMLRGACDFVCGTCKRMTCCDCREWCEDCGAAMCTQCVVDCGYCQKRTYVNKPSRKCRKCADSQIKRCAVCKKYACLDHQSCVCQVCHSNSYLSDAATVVCQHCYLQYQRLYMQGKKRRAPDQRKSPAFYQIYYKMWNKCPECKRQCCKRCFKSCEVCHRGVCVDRDFIPEHPKPLTNSCLLPCLICAKWICTDPRPRYNPKGVACGNQFYSYKKPSRKPYCYDCTRKYILQKLPLPPEYRGYKKYRDCRILPSYCEEMDEEMPDDEDEDEEMPDQNK